MKHWIGVAHRKHALNGRAQVFCAVSHGKETAAQQLTCRPPFSDDAPHESFGRIATPMKAGT